VKISPAPGPLGAPSIGKKESPRRRTRMPTPAHRFLRELWHPPQADESKI
jgi:hypothetical protein